MMEAKLVYVKLTVFEQMESAANDGVVCTTNISIGADNSRLLKYSCCSCKQSNTTLVEILQTGKECAKHCYTTFSNELVTEGSPPCKRSKCGKEDTSTDHNMSCYHSHPVAQLS